MYASLWKAVFKNQLTLDMLFSCLMQVVGDSMTDTFLCDHGLCNSGARTPRVGVRVQRLLAKREPPRRGSHGSAVSSQLHAGDA